jgi:hypothetical protein
MPEITRSLAVDGTFRPEAVNFLGNIPDKALFHVQHGLRHPESLYQFSLDNVAAAFTKVAEAYLSKTSEYRDRRSGAFDLSDLLHYQESFLHAAREHVDDCYLILKTLVDPAATRKSSRFAEEFVIDNRLAGAKAFQQSMESYKKTFLILNKLKHQQGRLRGISIWTEAGAHIGYFLEEPDSEGRLGPSPELHPDQGAISFARDLPWHMFNIYRCSNRLVEAIRKALVAIYGVTIRPKIAADDDLWRNVVRLAEALPPRIFSKEVPKKVATFRRSDHDTVLVIRFPIASLRSLQKRESSGKAKGRQILAGYCQYRRDQFPSGTCYGQSRSL